MIHRNNRIVKVRQYISGYNIILPAWSRQSLFIPANNTESTGHKIIERLTTHLFAHDKAPP